MNDHHTSPKLQPCATSSVEAIRDLTELLQNYLEQLSKTIIELDTRLQFILTPEAEPSPNIKEPEKTGSEFQQTLRFANKRIQDNITYLNRLILRITL